MVFEGFFVQKVFKGTRHPTRENNNVVFVENKKNTKRIPTFSPIHSDLIEKK